MMKRGVLVLAIAAQLSCANHPALTVGISGGLVAGVVGEANELPQKTVGLVTAIVALGLGGLTWLITSFADTSAHELPNDEEITTDGRVKLHTHTDLPPVPLDAGVVDAAAPTAVDAGVAPID